MPAGVIQFVPGPAEEVVGQAVASPNFAALHFTGSTFVFKKLWKDIASNLDKYKSYPRIVGETGALKTPAANRVRDTDYWLKAAKTSTWSIRLLRSRMR